MMNASQPHYTLIDYEASFDSQAAVAWAAEHPDLPVFAVALYLAFVFMCRRSSRTVPLSTFAGRGPCGTWH